MTVEVDTMSADDFSGTIDQLANSDADPVDRSGQPVAEPQLRSVSGEFRQKREPGILARRRCNHTAVEHAAITPVDDTDRRLAAADVDADRQIVAWDGSVHGCSR